MKIKALVPVRSGSVRVKNKNIAPFANSSLLEIKIEQLKRIKELDGIVVNSNSDEMLKMAEQLGVETVKRDEYYASSTVPINEVYKNIAQNFDADIMLYANVTNPLLEDETIRRAIKKYYDVCSDYDSLNTAHLIKEFLWLNGKAINYDPCNMPRSQELPNISALNFAINISTTQSIIKNSSVVGSKPYILNIDEVEALDIDNQIDFDFAEFIYKKKHG